MLTCFASARAAARRPVADALCVCARLSRAAPSIAHWQILIALMVVSIASARLIAAEPMGNAYAPHNSHDEAVRLIPFDKLTPEMRGKVTSVIRDVSIYRSLPTQTVDCEPDLFRFLMINPDVLVNIWHVMGISNIALDRIGPDQYRCADGDGTTANVDVVYRGPQVQVIYAEGLYDGPLFPRPVRGQCVAVLQYTNTRMANGRYEETAHLDTFLHVDNVGVELLAKVFQGLVGRTIDHNFAETVAFIGSVSHTAEINPRGIRRLAGKLDHVEPERRSQFVAVTDHVATKLADAKPADDNAALAQVIDPATIENLPHSTRK
jgi:hypothetical protein